MGKEGTLSVEATVLIAAMNETQGATGALGEIGCSIKHAHKQCTLAIALKRCDLVTHRYPAPCLSRTTAQPMQVARAVDDHAFTPSNLFTCTNADTVI